MFAFCSGKLAKMQAQPKKIGKYFFAAFSIMHFSSNDFHLIFFLRRFEIAAHKDRRQRLCTRGTLCGVCPPTACPSPPLSLSPSLYASLSLSPSLLLPLFHSASLSRAACHKLSMRCCRQKFLAPTVGTAIKTRLMRLQPLSPPVPCRFLCSSSAGVVAAVDFAGVFHLAICIVQGLLDGAANSV